MAENRQDKSIPLQNSAGSRPSSANKDDTMHWFAHLGPHSSSNTEDKEARIKTFKERQNEERQKKLDEMKNQALAAQRFKEQKEYERRQRLEELRVKEDERRQQVEERKKAINDAERDRLESILKRNQEREARIEAKRRTDMKSSLVFAFGSSTPRVLGPADSSSSFWGHRRATSTQNITYSTAPLTRRQSERELDGGSKNRATSAGGIERSGQDMRMSTSMYAVFHWDDEPDSSQSPKSNYPVQAISSKTTTNFAAPQHPAGCISGYVGCRRTDLMPTIPAKESPSTPPRKPFMRSPAPSRPSSSLSQQSTSSVTSSVIMRSRPATAPRRPRPASIADTGISNDTRNGTDFKKPENKPPLPKVRKSSLVKSQEKIGKKKSLISPTEGSSKTILSPTTATTVTTVDNLIDLTPTQSSVDKEENPNLINVDKLIVNGQTNTDAETSDNQQIEQLIQIEQHPSSDVTEDIQTQLENIHLVNDEKGDIEKEIVKDNIVKDEGTDKSDTVALTESQLDMFENQNEAEMTTSMSSKPRITTEEEAKAALAERRRIAREEAEKQAELERLRIEEEARLEIERQQREEEQQRQLIELQRAAEEERLKEAIKEAQRREEEERLRREEELRLKVLKEEAERKAREEAERQKAELQERLKNEEKEREARRKRVEAIMLRTRGKNNSNNIPQTDEKNVENKFDSKVNGSKTDTEENGHNNGKEIETVDNIIPVDTIKNANTVNVTALSADDTLNSNDAWQRNSQTDLLM